MREDDVVGLGQLLKVIGALQQHGVMVELLIPDLHHVQDDLGVLRVVLVPAVVQGFAGSGQGHGRDQLNRRSPPTPRWKASARW